MVKIWTNSYVFLSESFVVCKNFELPEGYQPNLINPLLHNTNFDWRSLKGSNRFVVPFMCCGDLSAFDSDKGDVLKVSIFIYDHP